MTASPINAMSALKNEEFGSFYGVQIARNHQLRLETCNLVNTPKTKRDKRKIVLENSSNAR